MITGINLDPQSMDRIPIRDASPLTLCHIIKKCILGFSGVMSFTSCDVNVPPKNYDLESTSVTVEPKEVFVGDGVVLSYIVTNKGSDTIPAGSYDVDLYLEKIKIAFDRDTPALEDGMNVEYGMADGAYHWKAVAPGTYKFQLIVDGENRLDETDEDNNQTSGFITVKKR
jgi:hypothetical protein